MLSPDGLPNGTNLDNKIVEASDGLNNKMINIYQGNPTTWSGWHVPNAGTMATKSDVTTAVSTATANMVDSSKPTNFTAGLKSGGVDVATAADLKSIEASAWKLLVNSDATTAFYRLVDGTLYISGYARVGGNFGNTYANLKIVRQLPTELQNKVWTIKHKMTVGLNDGSYDMTADLYFGKDSSLSATSSAPTGATRDGIVIFNNSYTQS